MAKQNPDGETICGWLESTSSACVCLHVCMKVTESAACASASKRANWQQPLSFQLLHMLKKY